MVYSREIVIKELQHKYKIGKNLAQSLYNSYEKSGELEVLSSLLFELVDNNTREECVYDV